MMIQESWGETNSINQIVLTNTVTCSIKFKPSNYKNSLCWHFITNTSMVLTVEWLSLNTVRFRKDWCSAVRVVCVWLPLLVLQVLVEVLRGVPISQVIIEVSLQVAQLSRDHLLCTIPKSARFFLPYGFQVYQGSFGPKHSTPFTNNNPYNKKNK